VSQPHFGAKCENAIHTPKSGKMESSETPKNLELDLRGQISSHWSVLYINGKVLKLDAQNGLAWAVWTSAAQVMGKRRVGSQTGSLTPDH